MMRMVCMLENGARGGASRSGPRALRTMEEGGWVI
jgi:hypothetical protein